MLRSIRQFYGKKLGTPDGEVGHVSDLYFDDRKWTIRYLVVDTGTWLTGRRVLISPHSLGQLEQLGGALRVNLTRKQIEDSPLIDTHKPLSRQYEEEYYRYYGWPCYWQGDGLWGLSDVPALKLPRRPVAPSPAGDAAPQDAAPDAHLRATQAIAGYRIHATDGLVGHICDFLADDRSWAITQLVVKTGHRFSGKEVRIGTSAVDRISWEESSVFVNLTKDAVEHRPIHDSSAAMAAC